VYATAADETSALSAGVAVLTPTEDTHLCWMVLEAIELLAQSPGTFHRGL
jgi:hypothetical protein